MNPDSTDQRTYDEIRQWLDECDSRHVGCRALNAALPESSRSPTRLVNVSGTGIAKLHYPLPGEHLKYAALAYC
jgi:hypothetical protein